MEKLCGFLPKPPPASVSPSRLDDKVPLQRHTFCPQPRPHPCPAHPSVGLTLAWGTETRAFGAGLPRAGQSQGEHSLKTRLFPRGRLVEEAKVIELCGQTPRVQIWAQQLVPRTQGSCSGLWPSVFPFVKWKHQEDTLISATRCASRRLALRCRCCHPPRGPRIPPLRCRGRRRPLCRPRRRTHPTPRLASRGLPLSILRGGRPAPEAGSQQCRRGERRAPSGGKRLGGRRGKRGARRRGHTCFPRRLGTRAAAAAAAAGGGGRAALAAAPRARGDTDGEGAGSGAGKPGSVAGGAWRGRWSGHRTARLPAALLSPSAPKRAPASRAPLFRCPHPCLPSSSTQTLAHTPPHFSSPHPDAWHRSVHTDPVIRHPRVPRQTTVPAAHTCPAQSPSLPRGAPGLRAHTCPIMPIASLTRRRHRVSSGRREDFQEFA